MPKKKNNAVELTESAAENLQHSIESLVEGIRKTARRKKQISLFGPAASAPEDGDSLEIQVLLMLRDEYLLSQDDPEQRARCMALMVRHTTEIEQRAIKTGQVSASVLTSLARLRQLQEKLEMERAEQDKKAIDAERIVSMSTDELERLASGQTLDVEAEPIIENEEPDERD